MHGMDIRLPQCSFPQTNIKLKFVLAFENYRFLMFIVFFLSVCLDGVDR